MIQTMVDVFVSGFQNPSAWGIFLALAFGAAWLAPFAPWVLRLPTTALRATLALLGVFVSSAILTWAAISFVQVSLQTWYGQALAHFWDQETLMSWLLLAAAPQILITGLVQEAAKLLPPLVLMRWHRPQGARLALIVGAVSGAGFGIFEGQWALNMIFASGWNWGTVQLGGFQALLGFWERFFAIAFHIGASAIAVYGLFRGRWWQFYLLAAFLHAFVNYSVVLLGTGYLTTLQIEIWVAVVALITVGIALWLRWRPERGPAAETAMEADGE